MEYRVSADFSLRSPRFIERVSDIGFPLPELFAWAAGGAEAVGGGLLAFGLLTRPASAFILVTNLIDKNGEPSSHLCPSRS